MVHKTTEYVSLYNTKTRSNPLALFKEYFTFTGTTTLSQKHYTEDILRTYGFWGSLPLATMLPPHTCLSKDDCDPAPERAFHLRYRGIVGSLGYLVYDPTRHCVCLL
jgi:hypothetical protein